MGTTADKLNYLSNTKSLIKNAIINKGQTVNSGDSFRSFASKIENIQTGVNLNDYWNMNPTSGAYSIYALIKQFPENINTSNWSTLNHFFQHWGQDTGVGGIPNIPNWNTSNVKSLLQTFDNCQITDTNLPLNWDTSNVTNMHSTFRNAHFVKNIPPNWNTAKVTNFFFTFGNCQNLREMPNWNTCNATDMTGLFYGCTSLNTIPNLNTIKVTKMPNMFEWCYALNTVPNLDVSNVIDMQYMFSRCRNLSTVPNLNTTKAINMQNMFYGCSNLNIIPQLKFNNAVNTAGMFAQCNIKLLTISDINITSLTEIINGYGMFEWCTNLQTISNLTIGNINNAYYTFRNCTNLTNISNLKIFNIFRFSYAFENCTNLDTISDFKLININGAGSVFSKAFIKNIINLNLQNSTISSIFSNCQNLITAINIDVSNVTNLQTMFNGCLNLVNFSILNTTNITNIYWMFSYCNNLSDTSIQNIINMCLNSNITSAGYKNLLNTNGSSPFYRTNIANTRYQNRWSELTAAGWTY